MVEKEFRNLAKEFRYQEFPDGDYLDEMLEDEVIFKRRLDWLANSYIHMIEALDCINFSESQFKTIKIAIMAEFGYLTDEQ